MVNIYFFFSFFQKLLKRVVKLLVALIMIIPEREHPPRKINPNPPRFRPRFLHPNLVVKKTELFKSKMKWRKRRSYPYSHLHLQSQMLWQLSNHEIRLKSTMSFIHFSLKVSSCQTLIVYSFQAVKENTW